jgi:hypothetical protein
MLKAWTGFLCCPYHAWCHISVDRTEWEKIRLRVPQVNTLELWLLFLSPGACLLFSYKTLFSVKTSPMAE